MYEKINSFIYREKTTTTEHTTKGISTDKQQQKLVFNRRIYKKNVITIQAIVKYMCYFLMSLKKRLKLRKCMFEISLINLQFKRFSNEKQEAGCRMSTKLQEKVIFQKEQSFSFSRFPFSRQSTGALSVCIFFFAFCFTRHKRFYSKQVFFYYCF